MNILHGSGWIGGLCLVLLAFLWLTSVTCTIILTCQRRPLTSILASLDVCGKTTLFVGFTVCVFLGAEMLDQSGDFRDIDPSFILNHMLLCTLTTFGITCVVSGFAFVTRWFLLFVHNKKGPNPPFEGMR